MSSTISNASFHKTILEIIAKAQVPEGSIIHVINDQIQNFYVVLSNLPRRRKEYLGTFFLTSPNHPLNNTNFILKGEYTGEYMQESRDFLVYQQKEIQEDMSVKYVTQCEHCGQKSVHTRKELLELLGIEEDNITQTTNT